MDSKREKFQQFIGNFLANCRVGIDSTLYGPIPNPVWSVA